MRARLRYTLVADGSSDACLMRIIDWVFATRFETAIKAVSGEAADFRLLNDPPKTLEGRIRLAHALFPSDILFIHRDAESQVVSDRQQEIESAYPREVSTPFVPVIPVRMTEAWLLIDEPAIRRAADNPNGRTPLDLPTPRELERIVDPKALLKNLLMQASGKRGRNRRKFETRVPQKIHRVADLIQDFSVLERLPAFGIFCSSLERVVEEYFSE